ncbi:MAG: amidohydrolase [Chloroflexi bacterium]|nr:MAG: amidohydrolase [Chloroflexota bacterium]
MTLVIDNVRIVEGPGNPPLGEGRVVIEGERITAAGPRAGAGPYGAPIEVPPGAEIIDGTGKSVVPGLIDVHVHDASDANMALYVKSGVTSIRFAGGQQRALLQLRDRIERGETPGPRVFSCGHALDATPHVWPGSYAADSPLEARRIVRRAVTTEKVDAILATHRITRAILDAIVDEAHVLGVPVTGQLWSASAREAAEAGMDGLENTSRIPEDPGFSHERLHARHSVSGRIATLAHLWSTADKYRLEDIGGLLAERGVWLAPELVSFEAWAGLSEKEVKAERDWPQGQDPRVTQYDRHNAYISSEWTKDDFAAQAKALEAMKEFLGAFVKAGGSLVTGTDLGFGGILLHRELRHFADFLTPLETIRTATRAAASDHRRTRGLPARARRGGGAVMTVATERTAVRDNVVAAIDTKADELIAISRDIHAHPELNFEERHAAQVLADALERWGFVVERGVGGVETAFRASARGRARSRASDRGGNGTTTAAPTIAFLAEYDALPEIGHACGHNLIAISNLGAGLGAKAALDELAGTIQVIGTPAEEGGGGKIRLLEAGVFEGVDVALSSHPGSHLTLIDPDPKLPWGLALIGYRYAYHGKAAHAAMAPQEGINALNAVLRLFSGIDTLRQHVRDDVRIHGVITDGGKAPNIVPDFAAANFMLRARDRDHLKVVVEKVRAVAEGAALETGARLEVIPYYPFPTPRGTHRPYEEARPNAALARLAIANAPRAGLALDQPPPSPRGGAGGASSDFGNVSQVVPSLAVSFKVAEKPTPGHSPAMREAAITDLAHRNALAVAKTLALVAVDLLADPAKVAEARGDFTAREDKPAAAPEVKR